MRKKTLKNFSWFRVRNLTFKPTTFNRQTFKRKAKNLKGAFSQTGDCPQVYGVNKNRKHRLRNRKIF